MSNEIIKVTESGAGGMTALQVCEQTEAISKIGEVYAASGFFGKVTASTATAALINCFVEGLSPVQYRAKYHTMEDGTTAVKSDYIQREFHRRGGKWRFVEWTSEVCEIEFTYDGQTLSGRVTLAEFKDNGVATTRDGKTLKTNWAKFPREMLKARCMATYIRALCPEALGGLYTDDEARDFTPLAPTAPKPQGVATVTGVSPSPIAPEVVDFEVCPIGKSKGKRFDELPNETLEKMLAAPEGDKFAALTHEHRAEIAKILDRRAEEANGGDNN